MARADQHHVTDVRRRVAQPPISEAGNGPGIRVSGVRDDQRLRTIRYRGAQRSLANVAVHSVSQLVRILRIEEPGDRWRSHP